MKKYLLTILISTLFTPCLLSERLYFNINTIEWWNSTGDTGVKGEGNFAYFFNGTTNAWSEHSKPYTGNIYYVDIPAGKWTNVILTRHSVSSNPNWTNIINEFGEDKTGDLTLGSGNYIRTFSKNSTTCTWGYVPYGDPASIMTVTEDHVCQSAIGEPYTLDKKQEITNCQWFVYKGNKQWEEMIPGIEKDSAYIPIQVSDAYYYLGGDPVSAQRMLHIMPDQDCQLSCEITSFEMVSSSADIQNKTFAIDGLVAFAKADGALVISCEGKSTTIASPASPQVFKLKGIPADGKQHIVTAQFQSGEKCSKNYTILAPTPGTQPAPVVFNRYIGDTLSIHPKSHDSDNFKWSDGCTTHDRSMQLTEATTQELTYTEYNTIPDLPTNLLSNSSYENDIDYTPYSEYSYWGRGDSLNNFYETHPGYNGGFAVVTNSNAFANTYATVTAHDGNWFALFDADNSGKKNAWYVTSQATAPNLKIEKGMSYMFSFWVCNINNFAQMDNCAILQFYIQCDNGIEQPLGEPINLKDYRDNLWHQNSAIYTATTSSSKVKIMVKDLNTSVEYIGNDFGLDDIRFQAISVNTEVVHALEVFTINCIAADEYTRTYSFCHTEKQTCSATQNQLNEPVSRYEWGYKKTDSHTLKDSVYYHPMDLDPTQQTHPKYFDTLVCKSYKQSYQQEILVCKDTFFLTVDPCDQCDDTLILRKWNDVLFIQNQSDRYVAYQWLKNNQIIPNETKQFIDLKNDPDILEAYYGCLVTTQKGEIIRACNRKVSDPDSHSKKTESTSSARKIVANGKLYIEINGKLYSVLGTLQ